MSDFKMPEKLPILRTQADRDMTEEDWKEYFECRKKYDRPLSIEENIDIGLKAMEMEENGASDEEVMNFKFESCKMLNPQVAYVSKCLDGLKSIQKFNLYNAKKVFPNEF